MGGSDGTAWKTRRRDLVLAAIVGLAIHVLAYSFANHFPHGNVRQLSMTFIDRAVPFVPWTVFIYVSDYVLVFFAFFLCRSRDSAVRFFWAQMGVIAFSTLIHWAVPIAFPRELYPLPPDLSPLPAFAMKLVRGFDAPTSCLPSLHVADSVLAPLLLWRERPKAFPWLLTWAGAISISTLTTKQHYLLDVVTGIALAMVTALIAEWSAAPRGERRGIDFPSREADQR